MTKGRIALTRIQDRVFPGTIFGSMADDGALLTGEQQQRPYIWVLEKFSNYVLIQNLDGHTSEEDIWREMNLDVDPKVSSKLLTLDRQYPGCRMAVVTFQSPVTARRAVFHLDGTTVFERKIEALHVGDYLRYIHYLEETVIEYRRKRKGYHPSDHEVKIVARSSIISEAVLSMYFSAYGQTVNRETVSDACIVTYVSLTGAYSAYLDMLEDYRRRDLICVGIPFAPREMVMSLARQYNEIRRQSTKHELFEY